MRHDIDDLIYCPGTDPNLRTTCSMCVHYQNMLEADRKSKEILRESNVKLEAANDRLKEELDQLRLKIKDFLGYLEPLEDGEMCEKPDIPPVPPKGWRLLDPDEPVSQGDIFLCEGSWAKSHAWMGDRKQNTALYYARKYFPNAVEIP